MKPITDRELLLRIKRSDKLAFYNLIERHWKTWYLQAMKETGNEDDAVKQINQWLSLMWDQRKQLTLTIFNDTTYFQQLNTRPSLIKTTSPFTTFLARRIIKLPVSILKTIKHL